MSKNSARGNSSPSGTGIRSVTSDPSGTAVRISVAGAPWIVKFDPHSCQMLLAPEDRESPTVVGVPFRTLVDLYQQQAGALVRPVSRPGLVIPS